MKSREANIMPIKKHSINMKRRGFLKNVAMASVGAGGAVLLNGQTIVSAAPAVNTYPNLNVKDYGAAGNGIINDTLAFQNALNDAGAAGGGIVVAPRGTYN